MKNATATADPRRSRFVPLFGLMFVLAALAACGKDPAPTAAPVAGNSTARESSGAVTDKTIVSFYKKLKEEGLPSPSESEAEKPAEEKPVKKAKKVKIESSIQKSINILQAYGEYDSFKDY
jgi:hypothetical protein